MAPATAGLDALAAGLFRIQTGEWDRAIVGARGITNPYQLRLPRLRPLRWRNSAPPFPTRRLRRGSGAVTFILESRRSLEQRALVAARGRVLACSSFRSRNNARIAALSTPRARSHPLFRQRHPHRHAELSLFRRAIARLRYRPSTPHRESSRRPAASIAAVLRTAECRSSSATAFKT